MCQIGEVVWQAKRKKWEKKLENKTLSCWSRRDSKCSGSQQINNLRNLENGKRKKSFLFTPAKICCRRMETENSLGLSSTQKKITDSPPILSHPFSEITTFFCVCHVINFHDTEIFSHKSVQAIKSISIYFLFYVKI